MVGIVEYEEETDWMFLLPRQAARRGASGTADRDHFFPLDRLRATIDTTYLVAKVGPQASSGHDLDQLGDDRGIRAAQGFDRPLWGA